MIGVFLGRFQPFHNDHYKICRYILDEEMKGIDTLAIGIGSSQYGYTKTNPFTCEERSRMIVSVLYEYWHEDDVVTFSIPDIHKPEAWADHVMECFFREFPQWKDKDIVIYTSNIKTKELFKDDYDVRDVPMGDIRASNVREVIGRKDVDGLKAIVPPMVFEFLTRTDACTRIWYLQQYGMENPKYE